MVAWARLGPVKQRHDNAGKGTQHCVITPELCRSYTRVNHVNLASVPIVLLTQLTAVPQELVNVPPHRKMSRICSSCNAQSITVPHRSL